MNKSENEKSETRFADLASVFGFENEGFGAENDGVGFASEGVGFENEGVGFAGDEIVSDCKSAFKRNCELRS